MRDSQKYRHEYKFLINEIQSTILQYRIKSFMQKDKHADRNGIYCIRSVYFDDYADTCVRQNRNGVDPRSKYRIRVYNASDQMILLEHKLKCRGMTRKEKQLITRSQCDMLLKGELLTDKEFLREEDSLLCQFNTRILKNALSPKVLVEYERTPFIENCGNVRVTFDKRLSSSDEVTRIFDSTIRKRPVMPTNQHVMEVKYDEFLPSYIKEALELGSLRQTAYSKYCLCRNYCL